MKNYSEVINQFTPWLISDLWTKDCKNTRVHSSRMRTVRCSGHLSGDVYPGGCLPGGVSARGCVPRGVCAQGGVCPGGVCPGGCVPRGGVCPGGCLPRGSGVSSHEDCLPRGFYLVEIYPGGVCLWGCIPPVDRNRGTRSWKHHLSATTVADGNNNLNNKNAKFMNIIQPQNALLLWLCCQGSL